MSFNEAFVVKLEKHLRREIKLYDDYLKILETERQSVTSFKSHSIQQAAVKRKLLTDAIAESHERRMELLSQNPESEGIRLTEFIEAHAPRQHKKRLLKLALELRDRVVQSHQQGQAFQQVVQFAINTVNGTLGIFSHASQNVTRQYGRGGKVSESYNPRRTRGETVLKQA